MNKLPKIVMIIPCWQRADILSICMDQMDYFHNATQTKIDLTVLYVFSLNDPELKEILTLYKSAIHPRDFIYSANEQLGRKINDAIDYASILGYDYIMNSGSDDLYHPELIDLYLPFIYMEIPFFGIKSCWFYEFDRPSLFFSYYNSEWIVGAGRMIHKTVIEKVKNEFGELYLPNINRGMDTMSARRIMLFGYNQIIVNSKDLPLVVDVKSPVNINSFDSLINNTYNKPGCYTKPASYLENIYPVLAHHKNQIYHE
jgi:hypothetical protein